LFGREFSADVEGAGDVHGHVIERRGEIEHDELVRFDFMPVSEIVNRIDIRAGAYESRGGQRLARRGP
jgi:hypothetical protein